MLQVHKILCLDRSRDVPHYLFSDDNYLSLSFPDRFVLTTDGSVMQRTMVKYGYYSSLNLMTCWCISHGHRGIRMCNLNDKRL